MSERVKVYRDENYPTYYIAYKDSKSPRPDKEWWIASDTYLRLTSTDDVIRLDAISRLVGEILDNWEHDHEVVNRDNPDGPIFPQGAQVQPQTFWNCGDRYSHGPHYRETDGAYCSGRSYDQT